MINIREFRGSRPALHPYNQPLSYGTKTSNLWLRSGEYQPMRANQSVPYGLPLDGPLPTESIQIVRRNDGSYDYLHIPDISLAESVSVNDINERVYFGAPPVAGLNGFAFMLQLANNYTDAIDYAVDSIGPFQPPAGRVKVTTANTLPSGGGDDTTVLYVTYLLPTGEESVPSLPSVAFGFDFDITVGITVKMSPASYAMAGFFRVYMEVDGTARLLTERTAATYDAATEELIIGGIVLSPDETTEEMATLDSYPPPVDGYKNVITWHNGMLAAVSQDNRSVLISEPGNALSWPRSIPFARNIVRIMRSGDNLVVLTDSRPSVIVGGSPETAQEVDLDFDEPCISAQSAVDMGFGIVYCSHNGICVISNGSGYIATQDNRFDGGTAVIDPWEHDGRGVVASSYHGQYIYYTPTGTGSWKGRSYSFKYAELMDLPSMTGNKLFMVKNPDADLGQETLELFTAADFTSNLERYRFQAGDNTIRGNWERKIELPRAEPVTYGRVTAEDYNDIYVTVGDWTKHVTDNKPFAVKSTKRSRITTIGITGASVVQALQLAHSIEELY